MSPVAPSEEAVKGIVADLTAKIVLDVEKAAAGWPKEAQDLGQKLVAMVTEQVNNFLSGDLTALRDALVRDITKLASTGKGPTAKSFSDIA